MIQKFKHTDTEAVMAIWLQETTTAHGFISKAYWQKAFNKVRDAYLLKSDTFVYKANGGIQGFVSVIDESTIGALFIISKYKRQGIGRQLLDAVKVKHRTLNVSVYTKNTVAIAFYLSQGFVFSHKQTDTNTGEVERVYIFKKMGDINEK